MNTSSNNFQWHAAMKSLAVFSLAVPMVLSLGILLLTNDVFAQPTLKEVIEKKTKEGAEGEPQTPVPPTADSPTPKTPMDQPKPVPVKIKPIHQDELNRGVPRTSIHGFLEKGRERDFEKAAEYLDLRNLPDKVKNIPAPELIFEVPGYFLLYMNHM